MLKQRVLTALLLVPLLLVVIFLLPSWVFELVVALAILGAAWEWSVLMGCTTRLGRFLFLGSTAAAIALATWGVRETDWLLAAIVALSIAWWVWVFIWLAWHPRSEPPHRACMVKGLCGLLTLVPAYVAVVALHALGAWQLVFLLALVWLADVGAFFAGRAFGRHKLAPVVSPGKTWEGVAGAFLTTLLMIGIGLGSGLAIGPLWYFAPLCVLTVGISIVGDLAESMFKRQQGVKDSGTLLPGHGGLLDRIDSLTSAAPWFMGGILLAEQLG